MEIPIPVEGGLYALLIVLVVVFGRLAIVRMALRDSKPEDRPAILEKLALLLAPRRIQLPGRRKGRKETGDDE